MAFFEEEIPLVCLNYISLLCFLSFLSDLQILLLIFRRNYQKTKRFTILFGMLTVVDIVRIDHSVEIIASVFGSPF
jgi:hypothetical protein